MLELFSRDAKCTFSGFHALSGETDLPGDKSD